MSLSEPPPQNRCTGCPAPVVWVKTVAGRPMICDVELVEVLVPSPLYSGSKRTTIVTDDGRMVVGHKLSDIPALFAPSPAERRETGRIPHWATCPNADTFRRKNRKP
jgi:hypothetical protein